MSLRSRDILKQWFKTGDYPTQQQFWDFIDSVFNLTDDQMPIGSIQGLTQLLQSKLDVTVFNNAIGGKQTIVYNADGIYVIPAGMKLESIIVIPDQDLSAFQVGKSAGLDDVAPIDPDGLAATVAHEYFLNIYAIADTTIYLQGIQPNTTIIFYKR